MGHTDSLIRTDTIHGRAAYPSDFGKDRHGMSLPFGCAGHMLLLQGKIHFEVYRTTLCMVNKVPSVAENYKRQTYRDTPYTMNEAQRDKWHRAQMFKTLANERLSTERSWGIR